VLNRREFVAAAIGSPFVLADGAAAQAPTFIGDMHFHSFFAESRYHSRPLAPALAAGNATLVAWSLVGDLLWFDPKIYKQKSAPGQGEALAWFRRELGRIKAHIVEQGLKTVQTASDVDLAMRGRPHIVLAVEGASFIENDASRVKAAHDLSIRHLQLVHYISNTIGDFQTQPPEHEGLSQLGRQVVGECNRLGVLIDLAHCSEAAARGALVASRVPVVWSHGSVTRQPAAPPSAAIWRRRQLSLGMAKEIAQRGGVVGLWALAPDVGKTVEAYADRMLELVEWLGEDHVAFGTDMNGLGPFSMLSGYADLQRVVERWRQRGVADTRIRKLAAGNYARVLKSALEFGRG
jgi:membrane dipeptidase